MSLGWVSDFKVNFCLRVVGAAHRVRNYDWAEGRGSGCVKLVLCLAEPKSSSCESQINHEAIAISLPLAPTDRPIDQGSRP